MILKSGPNECGYEFGEGNNTGQVIHKRQSTMQPLRRLTVVTQT